MAGGDFPGPVIGIAQFLELLAHIVDVAIGPFRRSHLVFHGGVLGRQAKGIPAHGLQHILAQHALIAADGITDGVVANVAHMQVATGIGEHGQAVELFPVRVLHDAKTVILLPVVLGSRFYFLRFVLGVNAAHACLLIQGL